MGSAWWRRTLILLAGPLLVAVGYAALSPGAAIGGLHSARAQLYVLVTLAVSVFVGWLVTKSTAKQWVAIAAGVLPAILALGAITIPTLSKRSLHEMSDVSFEQSALIPSRAPVVTAPVPSATASAAPVATLLGRAQLRGINHEAQGTISVYSVGARKILRFEAVNVQRVPDARIYLEPSAGAESPSSGGVSLGATKAEKGTFSYDLPAGYVLPPHSTLLIWCRAFSTPVANATLT